MIAHIYNHLPMLLNPLEDSDVLRAGCFLAGNVRQKGLAAYYITLPATFGAYKTYEQKLDFVVEVRERRGLLSAWDRQQFRNMRKWVGKKDFRPGIYEHIKGFRKLTDDYFAMCCRLELEHYERVGYLPLFDHFAKGELTCSWADHGSPEDPVDYLNAAPYSRHLLDGLEAGSEAEGHLFFLHPHLLAGYPQALVLSEDEGVYPQGHCARLLLRLPVFKALDPAEQQLLSDDLAAPLHLFRASMRRWIASFADPADTPAQQRAFSAEVVPAANALSESIGAHPLHKAHPATWGRLEVGAVVAPNASVWQALRAVNGVPDDTWNILQAHEHTGALLRPFLQFRYRDFAHEEMIAGKEVALPAKRSLNID